MRVTVGKGQDVCEAAKYLEIFGRVVIYALHAMLSIFNYIGSGSMSCIVAKASEMLSHIFDHRELIA